MMNVERPQQEQYGMYREQEHRRMRQGPSAAGMCFSAFALGAAIGGTLGLLFAPRRGKELRATLYENLPGQQVSHEFRNRVAHMLASGRTSPSELISQTQRDLDELRAQAINKIDDARLKGKIMQKQAELRYLKGKEKLRHELEG